MLWQIHLRDQIVDSLHSFFCSSLITYVGARLIAPNSNRFSSLRQLVSSRIQVEAHSMWQHDAVGNTMRHASRPTQHVAHAMMQRHCDMSKRATSQESSYKHFCAGLQVITDGIATWQRKADGMHTAKRSSRGEWIACDRVQRLDTVG